MSDESRAELEAERRQLRPYRARLRQAFVSRRNAEDRLIEAGDSPDDRDLAHMTERLDTAGAGYERCLDEYREAVRELREGESTAPVDS